MRFWTPPQPLKQHERFRGKFVIGCVARNQPRKNIPALVEAFARLQRYATAGQTFARTLDWDALTPQWLEVIGLAAGRQI